MAQLVKYRDYLVRELNNTPRPRNEYEYRAYNARLKDIEFIEQQILEAGLQEILA